MVRFIVEVLEAVLKIFFWITILFGGLFGAELMTKHPGIGFAIGCFVGFIASVLTCGTVFVLLEINKNIRIVRDQLARAATGA